MSERQIKKERRDRRRADSLEGELGKQVREVGRLNASVAALTSKLTSTAIELGIAKTALSLAMNNQGQMKAFFSKRALDKARSAVTVSVKVAKTVMTPEERAALIAGELHFQEQKKRSESRLILPEGVEGLEDLYTPEARAEAEAWVDQGIIVELARIPIVIAVKTGATFQEDPQSDLIDASKLLFRIEHDRGQPT